MTPFVIGVTGGSGSGKSSLCRAFARSLARPAQTIAQDAYYRDLSHLPLPERARTNFDHPEALELDLLAEHLAALKRGEAVDLPCYDFHTHSRRPETRRVLPCPVILVEGILVLADPGVRAQLDLRVFIDAPRALCAERRRVRDQRDRGRTRQQVEAQLAAMWPMYEAFVAPTRPLADLRLPGDGDLGESVDILRRAALTQGMQADGSDPGSARARQC